MVSQEIRKKAQTNLEKKIKETIIILNEKFLFIHEMKIPKISFDLKGATAGTANYHKNVIRLNKELLAQEKYVKEMVEDTLYHELAHIITDYLVDTAQIIPRDSRGWVTNKVRPHGKEWKMIMKAMGEEPSRTHTFEVKKRKMTKITYLCNCQEHEMTPKAHEKIHTGRASYTCKKCRTKLSLKPGAKFKKV